MGTTDSNTKPVPNAETHQLIQRQKRLLQQAQSIVQQLKLDESASLSTERKHLLARVLLYGHENLIFQLKQLTLQGRKKLLRYIRNINYQQIDLLYHKLIKNSLKRFEEDNKILDERKKNTFKPYSYVDKRLLSKNEVQKLQEIGKNILHKTAIVILIGGASTRFKSKKSQDISQKQYYKQKQEELSLFQVIMQKLEQLEPPYPEIYLITNQKNTTIIATALKKLPENLRKQTTICIQNIQPVLNLNGQVCLSNQKSTQLIELPNGCGDFLKASLRYQRINVMDDIKKKRKEKQLQYIYMVGSQNYLLKVPDLFLLGFLHTNNQSIDVAFKCTYPQNESQKFWRVYEIIENSFKGTRHCKVNDLDDILRTCDKSQAALLRRSPIWMNSAVVNIDSFVRYLQDIKILPQLPQMFNANKKKITYWNPKSKQMHVDQYCYVFQRQLSDLLINDSLRSKGIMVERQDEFLPVVCLQQTEQQSQYLWRDAYNQYHRKRLSKQINQEQMPNHPNYLQPVSLSNITSYQDIKTNLQQQDEINENK